jgi:hypothetical protein
MADIRDRTLPLASIRFDWTFWGYDQVFDGRKTFSDIDAVVNNNGHFLFIEHKRMKSWDRPPTLPPGQLQVYTSLAQNPNMSAWLVAGDMELSIPFWVENLQTGSTVDLRKHEPIEARKVLKDLLQNWYETTKPTEEKK